MDSIVPLILESMFPIVLYVKNTSCFLKNTTCMMTLLRVHLLGMKFLEGFTPCNIFETKTDKEDYCEREEDSYSQGYRVSDESSLKADMDGNDDYWTFTDNPIYETFENLIENPIYDMTNKGSMNLRFWGI